HPEERDADRVRVGGGDGDDASRRVPLRVADVDAELRLVELRRRVAYRLHGIARAPAVEPRDDRLARTGAGGVGDRDVVMEGDAELDHGEEERDDERRDERELDGGLSFLGADAAA